MVRPAGQSKVAPAPRCCNGLSLKREFIARTKLLSNGTWRHMPFVLCFRVSIATKLDSRSTWAARTESASEIRQPEKTRNSANVRQGSEYSPATMRKRRRSNGVRYSRLPSRSKSERGVGPNYILSGKSRLKELKYVNTMHHSVYISNKNNCTVLIITILMSIRYLVTLEIRRLKNFFFLLRGCVSVER